MEVYGVIYGSRGVEAIDQFASVDPDSGERTPEVVRLTTFGLAHHTETIVEAAGQATGGRPLRELVAEEGGDGR